MLYVILTSHICSSARDIMLIMSNWIYRDEIIKKAESTSAYSGPTLHLAMLSDMRIATGANITLAFERGLLIPFGEKEHWTWRNTTWEWNSQNWSNLLPNELILESRDKKTFWTSLSTKLCVCRWMWSLFQKILSNHRCVPLPLAPLILGADRLCIKMSARVLNLTVLPPFFISGPWLLENMKYVRDFIHSPVMVLYK